MNCFAISSRIIPFPKIWVKGMFFLLLVCCFTAWKREEEKKYLIGFSQCGDADNWSRSRIEEMRRELAFNPNLKLIYKQANDNSALQGKQVKERLTENIVLLIISPSEAAPLTPIGEEV